MCIAGDVGTQLLVQATILPDDSVRRVTSGLWHTTSLRIHTVSSIFTSERVLVSTKNILYGGPYMKGNWHIAEKVL